jgi:hypothetical protein
MVILVQLAQLV